MPISGENLYECVSSLHEKVMDQNQTRKFESKIRSLHDDHEIKKKTWVWRGYYGPVILSALISLLIKESFLDT